MRHWQQTFNRLNSKTRSVVKRVPILKQYVLNQQFRTERQLISKTHRTTCSHASILHFSVNRAATQYVKTILRRCAAANGLTNVGLHDYAFHSDFPYLNRLTMKEMEGYAHLFKPQGYNYSVFGGMIEGIPELEKFRTILMIRDPRDVLVSGYYAVAFSHFLPGQADKKRQFMSLRNQAKEIDIDTYVRQNCQHTFEIFDRYQKHLVHQYPTVYLTRFEDMVLDFSGWLSALLEYCQLDISDRLYQTLVSENMHLTPHTENIQRHLRKGAIGDYREKLSLETIEYINAQYQDTLKFFKYH